MEIWLTLKNNPEKLKKWYRERWQIAHEHKKEGYEKIKSGLQSCPERGLTCYFFAVPAMAG